MYIPTQEERYAKKGVVSLILCVGIVAWLKTTPLLSPKKAVCIALCLGMLDFLFVKLFPFPAQIMG
ncbi:MAG: hypothetical protein HFJ61_04395 [Akkermansia muciniphila]|nr:hypothetical protein [Akkermansia muciniphila]